MNNRIQFNILSKYKITLTILLLKNNLFRNLRYKITKNRQSYLIIIEKTIF